MAEVLSVHDQSWLVCHGWPSCFACAIDRAFIAVIAELAALLARLIMGLLPRMAEVWLHYIHNRCIDVALAGVAPCPDILFERNCL